MEDWTWAEAGEQALYGAISVLIVLIILTLLTMLSGRLITRFEKSGFKGFIRRK
ncbi:MAG: hypothetical protein R6U89_01505 [Dehalococcoidia bacterium]